MKQDIKERIFSKIEKEKIEPISKVYFENKNRALWFMIIVFALLAILFGGFLWDDSSELFGMRSMMRGNMGLFILPHIFWTLLIILLVFMGIKSFESTPTGHRKSYQLVIFVGIITIMFGSSIFRWFGFGPQFHSFLVDNIPMISSVLYNESSWNDAENGRLAGAIVSIDTNTLTLKSLDGKIWNISVIGSFTSPMVLGETDEKVRILGKKTGDFSFQSERIMPWFGKGVMRGGMMGKGSGSGGMTHGGGRGMMR